jgi:ATP:ADP antiporter, AAA family
MTDNTSHRTTAQAAVAHDDVVRLLRRFVDVEPREVMALVGSFAFFFCVLCSYYLLRPLRDEMGIVLGKDNLQAMLLVVLAVMLAAVPAFGWVVTNLPRARIVPAIYLFLISNLVAFWALYLGAAAEPPSWLAGSFFVWINVYVLFSVSLFWSFMSDIWASGQAKRLYGFISVGGSLGALTGPLLLNLLLGTVGVANLLLVSAGFLALALAISSAMRRALGGTASQTHVSEKPESGSLIAGAVNVWRSPYLFRIALVVLAANLIGMYFYLRQNEIVKVLMPDQTERLLLFSRIDLATNTLTILMQIFAVSRLIGRIGVGWTAAIPPIWCAIGVLLLAAAPALWSIALIVVIQRACAYGFSNPAMRMLYTVVDPVDKYRSQNFNDTFIYRGGEAATGYLFGVLAKYVGAAGPVLVALAVTAGWIKVAFDLGRRQESAAAELAKQAPDRP